MYSLYQCDRSSPTRIMWKWSTAATNISQIFTCYVMTVQTVGGGTNRAWADRANQACAVQFPKSFPYFEFVPLKCSSCRAFCKELSFPLKCNSTVSVKWNSCKSYSSTFGCVEVRRYVVWLLCTQVRGSRCLPSCSASECSLSPCQGQSNISAQLIQSSRLTNRNDHKYFS